MTMRRPVCIKKSFLLSGIIGFVSAVVVYGTLKERFVDAMMLVVVCASPFAMLGLYFLFVGLGLLSEPEVRPKKYAPPPK
jgi:hypothetical protein